MQYIAAVEQEFSDFIKKSYSIERNIIENIPIYEDFTTPKKEGALREFLLPYHIIAAQKIGISPLKKDDEISDLLKNDSLISIDTDETTLHYFYNVRKKYRFLTPQAAKGLKNLTERFQRNLNKRTKLPDVKIAVSSALRTMNYQNKLRTRNANASYASSHCYGISFDIFFDDYFVSLPLKESNNSLSRYITSTLRRKLGFHLGDSLRRQLRSVLMETLLELQEEGYIYAILERRQHCYHVTILK